MPELSAHECLTHFGAENTLVGKVECTHFVLRAAAGPPGRSKYEKIRVLYTTRHSSFVVVSASVFGAMGEPSSCGNTADSGWEARFERSSAQDSRRQNRYFGTLDGAAASRIPPEYCERSETWRAGDAPVCPERV